MSSPSLPCSLYFDKVSFSPRYGSEFFTVTCPSFKVIDETYAAYQISIVSGGGKTWEVPRRFSEFVSFREVIICDVHDASRVPQLPPKTCLRYFGHSHLETRRAVLEEFISAILQLEGMCLHPAVRSFLQLPSKPEGSVDKDRPES